MDDKVSTGAEEDAEKWQWCGESTRVQHLGPRGVGGPGLDGRTRLFVIETSLEMESVSTSASEAITQLSEAETAPRAWRDQSLIKDWCV